VQFQSHASAVDCVAFINLSSDLSDAVITPQTFHVRSSYCLKRLLMLVYQHFAEPNLCLKGVYPLSSRTLTSTPTQRALGMR
jgi:hypothetical protein